MERLSDILRRQSTPTTRTNTGRGDTATWPAVDAEGNARDAESCPICGGIGFVREDVPVDHPNFGKALPCECKERELADGRIDRFQRYSNLGGLTRLTFDNLSPYGNDPSPANRDRFKNAFDIAKAYAEEPAGWLVLLGHSGCGKTHLAAAIANYLLDKERLAFFAVVPDLLDHLRSTFGPNSDVTYDELFEKVRNVSLLVLDDLDTQGSTQWAQEKLYQILNHRFNAQLPTVVTSRLPLEEMEERIRTRLTDPVVSRVCYLAESGPDLPSYFGALDLKLLASMTFENFDRSGLSRDAEERASLRNAYRLAEGFAKQPEGWLVLQGSHGCGKTHLAAAIANYQRQAGRKVLFCPIAELLDYLRFTFSPDSKVSFDSLFEQVKTVPLLVLDDLVPQTGSPWANDKLFQIINYRYNAQLPTVFTTTASLDEIERRVSSRLGDRKLSTVSPIRAPDYRIDHEEPEERPKTRRPSPGAPIRHRRDSS